MPVASQGIVYSANITSDAATGVVSYFRVGLTACTDRRHRQSWQTLYAMPWRSYAGMTEPDKLALIMALRTGLAVVNAVPLPTFTR